MGLLLVRHSEAVEARSGLDDAARWLSAPGRARATASARALARKGITFQRFLTSPRVRAVQTAEIYASVLGFTGVIESLPPLSFSEPAQSAADALRGLTGDVAAFGHMPTLAEIVQLLSGEKRAHALATSEAVWLERGQVVWRLLPSD